MTDEDRRFMLTSEITDRLEHSSPAVTRAWIRDRELEADSRDTDTGEKLYLRAKVEEKIAEMPRGPYRKRPPTEEPPRHEH